MNKVIDSGPFQGIEVPIAATRAQADGDGVWWHPRDRTPLVLDRFKPEDDWSIQIVREASATELPQRNPVSGDFYVNAQAVVMRFPTVFITAELKSPTGLIVATATTLAIIDGPRAYEQGENNARNRLYEAIGLSGAHYLEDFQAVPAGAKLTSGTGGTVTPIGATQAAVQDAGEARTESTSPMSQVKAVPSTTRHGRSSRTAAPVLLEPVVPAVTESVATGPAVASASAAVRVECPEGVSPALFSQAQQLAAMKRVACPVFASDEDVHAFLQDIAA